MYTSLVYVAKYSDNMNEYQKPPLLASMNIKNIPRITSFCSYLVLKYPIKTKQRYLQINLIFQLTTKPSSENMVKYIYSNE